MVFDFSRDAVGLSKSIRGSLKGVGNAGRVGIDW